MSSLSLPCGHRPRVDRSYIFILVGSLVALQPLFQGRIAWRADGLLHFHRLAQLDRALRHGSLYPRWLPDMGLGFGFPLFNYYAPLSYYIVEPLRLAGLSVSTALLVSYALALLVTGLGTYLWVRDLFGQTAGLVAAIAAVYAPYTLYNVFHRGALAEAWGLAWFPLILWALRRLATRGRPLDFALTSLTYAALILTHNILAMICSPLLAGYALFLWLLHPDQPQINWRQGALLVGALALGLGLSAFFWVPAFFEKDLVHIYQLYAPGAFNYQNNFAQLSDLLAAPQSIDPLLINPSTPRSLGWPQIILAFIPLLALRRWSNREARAHLLLLASITLGLALMTLPISTPVWSQLALLRFVQFPWRFIGPAGLTLAALAGAGASQLPKVPLLRRSVGISLGPVIVMLATIIFALPWLFPAAFPLPSDPTPIDLIRFEAETGAIGTTSAGDYLPIGVHQLPPPGALLPAYQTAAPDYIVPRFDENSLPAGGSVVITDYSYNLTDVAITFDTPDGPSADVAVPPSPLDEPARTAGGEWTARFNWYFFPGWRGKLDGSSLEIRPEGPHGLISADIPPGRHRLTIAFGDTPLRRRAGLISLASLIALIGLTCLINQPAPHSATPQREGPGTRNPQPTLLRPRRRGQGLATFATLATFALFVLKTTYLDNHDTIFRRSRFDGQHVSGVQVPLQTNFGDEIVLIGYDLRSDRVRADGMLELFLYWRALPPLDTEYSIAVHLVDDRGWRYGQHDSQHPAGYPTSRWQASEYARDVHRLAVRPGAPPGEYTLMVSVYDGTGRRLDLLDPNGVPVGATYPLTRVQVTRPTRPPQLSDLQMEQSLPADLGGGLALLGLDLPSDRVNTGEQLALTLYWQARSIPVADYSARLRLVSKQDNAGKLKDGITAVEERVAPGRTDHPTSAWREGDVLRDNHSLLIPATTTDGDYLLRLDLLDENDQPLGPAVNLATVTVRAPEHTFDLPSPQHSLVSIPDATNLGGLAKLLGYDLSVTGETLAPGQAWQLTLYWQAQTTADQSYTVFVHLLDASDHIYSQRDQVPAAGGRPTTGWVAGEIIRDTYELTLADDAAPGEYQLEVGLYDPLSDRRLPLLDADGNPIDTRILLPVRIRVE